MRCIMVHSLEWQVPQWAAFEVLEADLWCHDYGALFYSLYSRALVAAACELLLWCHELAITVLY